MTSRLAGDSGLLRPAFVPLDSGPHPDGGQRIGVRQIVPKRGPKTIIRHPTPTKLQIKTEL
jgi:hypothetical protein